ncbi:MAG: ATP synthase F1 subunit epsilon [Nitrospirota bacterium]
MANSFHLIIVTPEKRFFEGEVISIIAPASKGYLGVLVNHAPLLTTLNPGKLTIKEGGGKEEIVFIGKGFLDIFKNRAIILTELVKE